MTKDPSEAGRKSPDKLRASPRRIRAHVEALEGERHGDSSPAAKRRAMDYVRSELASVGLVPTLEPFSFQGETHHNVLARISGSEPTAPRVLVGAHIDTVPGSPGADDNGSGVAGVLECARLLQGSFRATVEFAVFDLEEQQLYTYRVGSRRYTEQARKKGVEYVGALIFEMIGYTSTKPDSQRIPLLVCWKDIPRTGDFLAVVGDWKSRSLIEGFEEAAREAAPELEVYTHRTPFRGWLVWQTRLSDNASFWSDGYPALMITDTAFLRNPHYHGPGDTAATLDYDFTAAVVDATVELVRRLAI